MKLRPLVGIAGGSAAGKTYTSQLLIERFQYHNPTPIESDWYYKELPISYSIEDRACWNYDHPDAFDLELLTGHLIDLKAGRSVRCPVYDYSRHCRAGYRDISSGGLIVVNGLFILHWPQVRQLLDLAVFVEAGEELRLHRRIRRDTAERGRTEESVRRQFVTSVAPMHLQYVVPSAAFADFVVPGDDSGVGIFHLVCDRVQSFL